MTTQRLRPGLETSEGRAVTVGTTLASPEFRYFSSTTFCTLRPPGQVATIRYVPLGTE